MTREELLKFVNSNEVPFNYEDGIIAVHNKIMRDLTEKVWMLRESKPTNVEFYKTCNKIMRDILIEIK